MGDWTVAVQDYKMLSSEKAVNQDQSQSKNCLICYVPFNSESDDDGNVKRSKSLIVKQLDVIFILRNLLEVPSKRLQLFLKCLGNPEGWGVWVCPECNGGVQEATRNHQEMLEVAGRLRRVKRGIVEKIKENCEWKLDTGVGREVRGARSWGHFAEEGSVTDLSRNFVSSNNYASLSNPFSAGDAQAREVLELKSTSSAEDNHQPYLGFEWESDPPVKVELGEDTLFDPLQGGSYNPSFMLDEDDNSSSLPISSFINENSEDDELNNKTNDEDDADECFSDSSEFNEEKIREGRYYTMTKMKNFRCKRCGYNLSKTREEFITHVELHKSTPHKCEICRRVYRTQKEMREHLRRYHPSAFDRVRKMKKVLRKVVPVTDPDPTEEKMLGSGSVQEKIEEGVHYELTRANRFRCLKCEDKMSTTMEEFTTHVMLHKTSPFKCIACERVYTSEFNLRGHIFKHHPDAAWQIRKRSKVKKTRGQLSDEVNKVRCSRCTLVFIPEEIEAHQKLHDTSPHNCQVCGNVFVTPKYLQDHIRNSHPRVYSRMMEGEPVVLANVDQDELREKEKSIDEAQEPEENAVREPVQRKGKRKMAATGTVQCDKCPRILTREKVNAHYKLHETSVNDCPICGSVFINTHHLRSHMRRIHPKIFGEMIRLNPKHPLTVQVNRNGELFVKEIEVDPELFVKNEKIAVKPELFVQDKKIASKTANSKERLPCPLCQKFFFKKDSSEELCEHLETCPRRANFSSTSDKELTCPACKTFKCPLSRKVEFGEHLLCCCGDETTEVKRPPLSRRIFSCSLCPSEKYLRLEGFIEHYQDHFVNKWSCTHCPSRFLNKKQVTDHWNAKRGHVAILGNLPIQERYKESLLLPEVSWWCGICSQKFLNEEERDEHVGSSHDLKAVDKPHVCPECQKGYVCSDELNLHRGISHIAKNFRLKFILICDVCDHFCLNEKWLEDHKRRKHRINLFVCETCGAECNSKNNLDHHRQLHQDARNHQCDECSKSFTNMQYLRHHKLREHTPLDKEINPLVCKYCDKPFSSVHVLSGHIKGVHERKFKFSCHLCAFGALHQSRLNRHMLMKHEIGTLKKLKCSVEGCGQEFTSLHRLKAHKDRHEGTPKFFCKFCQKGFYHRNQLRRHEQIHTNAETKPFQCEICSKRFPLQNYLYIHLKSHRSKT